MSLQIWLPFTQNFENQGVHAGIMENVGVNLINTQEISGKSAYFNGSERLVIANTDTFLHDKTKAFSIAMWAKLPTSGSYMTLFCDRTKTGNGISIFWNPAERGFRFDTGNSGDNQTFMRFSADEELPTEWTHYCFVFNGKKKIIYKNGKLWKSVNASTMNLNAIGPNIYIGSSASHTGTHTENNYNYLIETYLNDYRVYNHEISLAEIQQLSNRLLVHYNFEDAKSSPNLFDISSYLNSAIPTRCDAEVYGCNGLRIACNDKTYGDPYIGTALRYDNTLSTQPLIYVHPNQQYCLSWEHISGLEMQKTYISFITSNGTILNENWYSIGDKIVQYGARRYYLFTTPNNTAAVHIRFGNGQPADNTLSTTIIDDICVRLGNTYDFSEPNSQGIIEDSSGNGYDAIVHGKCLSLNNDTNRGIKSIRLLGHTETAPTFDSCSYVFCDIGTEITPPAFTISFFAKLNAWGKQTSGIMSLSTVSDAQDYTTSTLSQYDNYFRINSSTQKSVVFTLSASSIIKRAEWHHYSFSWDGNEFTAYRDGSEIESKTMDTEICPFRYIFLGVNSAGGAVRDADITWGDFKLYMTALSKEEIELEAKVAHRIFKTGESQVAMFNETNIDKSIVNRQSVYNCKYIGELLELNDGSCWIQLSHHDNANQTMEFDPYDSSNPERNFDTNFVYKDTSCWAAFHLVNDTSLLIEDAPYEFMAFEQLNNGNIDVFRWTQTVNPMTAQWANVKPNTNTYEYNTEAPYATPAEDNGGMYRYENTNPTEKQTTYFCIANNNQTNWFGAFGAQRQWGINGTPAFCGRGTKGILDLYMRIDPAAKKYREFKNGIIMPTTIQEI